MTSHELARQLLEGPDLLVTIRGYEYGVNEVTGICPPPLLHLEANKGSKWCGLHEYHEGDEMCCNCLNIRWNDEEIPVMPLAIHLRA